MLQVIWIDHDRMREGAILTQLYDEADDEDKKKLVNYSLPPSATEISWTKADVVTILRKASCGDCRLLRIPLIYSGNH